jgi:hypothetical protein
MTFPIITADQRLAEKRGIKGCILGPSGIGKTSLLWTVDADTTLFFDLEFIHACRVTKIGTNSIVMSLTVRLFIAQSRVRAANKYREVSAFLPCTRTDGIATPTFNSKVTSL